MIVPKLGIFFKSTMWSVGGQLSYMILLFLSNIVLAQILSPSDFGKIAIISFFVAFFNILVESGLGGALVRRDKVSNAQYSTVFIFNLFVSLFLYILLFISAPFISDYYNDDKLKLLLRVQGIMLFINAFQIVPNISLIRDMNFKKINICKFIAVSISSIVGIFMAYSGKGVWSIVGMQITNILLNTLLINVWSRVSVSFAFSKSFFLEIYKFGVHTTLASMLTTFFDNIYNLVLSKFFAISISGNYFQAKKMIDMPNAVVANLNQGVLYSYLSKSKGDSAFYFKIYSSLFKIIMWGACTLFLFIVIYSSAIIDIVLGSKWKDSSFFLQILSFYSFFYILEQFNRVSFKVYDKTGIILKLEIFKKVLQAITIILGIVLYNINYLMFGYILIAVLSYLVNWWYLRRLVSGLSFWELIEVSFCIIFAVLVFLIYKNYLMDYSFIGIICYVLIFLLMFVFAIRQEIVNKVKSINVGHDK